MIDEDGSISNHSPLTNTLTQTELTAKNYGWAGGLVGQKQWLQMGVDYEAIS